ncbi:MAG: hypothetical protein RhofKO_07900 [Rhodothermales bacterium]
MLRLAPLACLFLLSACSPASPSSEVLETQGEPPSVFRSVLDQRARMVTMQLGDTFWVAYSAETGGLYRVWRDGVDFDGAVYTTAHGPQPTSIGPAYIVQGDDNPWYFAQNGQLQPSAVRYLGHELKMNGTAQIRVRLSTPLGVSATVSETPSVVDDRPGLLGFKRTFMIEGLTEGAEVAVDVTLASLTDVDSYATTGRFDEETAADGVVTGTLYLNADGPTTLTTYLAEPQIMPLVQGNDADKPEGLVLIERGTCVSCHNTDVQTVGPAYRAIAARYTDQEGAAETLAQKVISGGSGVWGEAMMAPHPDLSAEDALKMVNYILELDTGDILAAEALAVDSPEYPLDEQRDGTNGLAVNLYPVLDHGGSLDNLELTEEPFHSGTIPAVHFTSELALEVKTNFYAEITGFINIPEEDNYVFRLVSDDGGRLYLDGNLLIDHDGLHGPDPKDSELILKAGTYPIRIDYFQAGGGGALSLQWAKHGDNAFSVIPPGQFTFDNSDLQPAQDYAVLTGLADRRPGDQLALEAVHPSFAVDTIRPESFQPKVGGLDVMDDGRVVVTTWDAEGGVYILSNLDEGDPEAIEVQRFAAGLAEPLGVKVVDGEIYVLQKQELTRLRDTDGDGEADVYETVANDWGATSNFHEFAFGLVYQDGYFYAALATAILPGGASADPQNPDRGTAIKINKDTGAVEFIANGLRTPNGIGIGVDDEIFIADNQGDWLPSSKIVHIQEGQFYGSRSVDFAGTAGLIEKKPVVWLPQDEIGNSPSTPILMKQGPYAGQMIHGEVTHGGIKRVFVEEVEGQYQGALFRFTQGLEAGVNRLAWGPDGHLYIGGIGNPGNWGHVGKLMYGLQRMRYTGDPVFEMLAVRAQPDGFEIEFTEALADSIGAAASDYTIEQWYYEPTIDYGGPKLDQRGLEILDVAVSEDRKRVTLQIDGILPNHVVYFRLNDATMRSAEGRSLWTTEAWYTLNRIPSVSIAAE